MVDSVTIAEAVDLLECSEWKGYAQAIREQSQQVGDLLQQRNELLVALATFGKHKRGCASGWRASTGSSEIGPCDCGLDDALAKAEGK